MGNIFGKKYKKIKKESLEDISDFSDSEDSEENEEKVVPKEKVESEREKTNYICSRCSREFLHAANLDQHFWCYNKKVYNK